MGAIRFTDRTVQSLSTDRTQADFWDDLVPGLGVRVSGLTGRKTFVIRYRKDGRRPRFKLGTYPILSLKKARDVAKRKLARVQLGEDPASDRQERREARTVGELVDEYMEKHAKKNQRESTWKEDERTLKRDVLPRLNRRTVESVTRTDVIDVLEPILGREAPVLCNRTRSVMHRVFEFAVVRGYIENNPVTRVKPLAVEKPRRRKLRPSEIRQLWKALEAEPTQIAAVYKLILLTAQRPGQVCGLRWPDLEDGWWYVSEEQDKTGNPHRVPLSKQALAELEAVRAETPEWDVRPWAFPARRGGGHLRNLWYSADRIRQRMDGEHWTPHDLRRTAATLMRSECKVPRIVIAKVLNHADRGVTAIYEQSSYDDEKREALEAWGAHVIDIISSSS